jgi:nucleoside-diphosphate-sugar epimerase
MKNLLICGGEGFIGRNCLEFFAKTGKYNITSTYFSQQKYTPVEGVNYIQVDLRDENQVKKIVQGIDIIIQAAATTTGSKDVINKPYIHVTDNAVMNSWLFRESVLNDVEHLIFLSCTVMYQPKQVPQKESDWSPSDEIFENYFGVGQTKVYLENMCNFYSKLGKTKFTSIRHSNVYGPYDKYDLDKCHVVPAFVNKIINSKNILDIWGDGSAARDIIYIDDLVNMIDKVIEKQKTKYELYNCGLGKAYPIKDLANIIMGVNNKELELRFDTTKPNIPTIVVLDCQKANNELGWYPTTSVETGMRITSEWYKKNYIKNEKI